MNLQGKKILLLSANFFDYEKAIVNRLKEFSAEVDFYNERPSNSVFTKGIIRVKSSLYQTRIEKYYQKISHQTKNKNYDFFLLIKGETIPFSFLKEFRERNPAAKMIFYSYDAVIEYPKFSKLYSYFDLNFTFEPQDALKYQLHFRPLFFLNNYENLQEGKTRKYDVVFIGSAHTDRYLIGEKVREQCSKLSLKTFFYYYAPGKFTFILKKIFDKNLQKFELSKLSFKQLSHSEINDIYKDSFAVLDINKPFQNGLTMRTFEALASGKKLITTNVDVANYPFYHPENVLLLDRKKIDLDSQFFQTPFKKIEATILQKMSLDSWLECLFIENQDEFWGISTRGFHQ